MYYRFPPYIRGGLQIEIRGRIFPNYIFNRNPASKSRIYPKEPPSAPDTIVAINITSIP
jgi:hypothetical protein